MSSTPGTPGTPPEAASPPPDAAERPRYNVMAIIAFVGAFVIPVAGIVCGHLALAEFRRGTPERGREFALAGTVLGYVFTALWLVVIVLLVVALLVWGLNAGGHGMGSGFSGPGNPGRIPFPTPTPRFTLRPGA
jgi:peptidyl-prolyl cis-trans isomerase B (cyclophilin B)